MNQNLNSIRNLCYIGIFVAIISVLSQIAIPLPGGVPMTLGTFSIAFAAAILGAKRGATAAIVYVLLGTIGVPVFANFNGGFHAVLGPTGGFILSYPIMAFIIGFGADKKRATRLWLAFALVIGSLVNLSMGTVQFAFVGEHSLMTAFRFAFAPFIVVEMVKMGMVFLIAPEAKRLVWR